MSARTRPHWPTLGVVLATALFWAVALFSLAACRVADAAPAVTWDRSYVQGDSLVVPVRWSPSCDALGCADAYRITWTWGDSDATRPTSGGVVASPVIREAVVTVPHDSVRVPLPAIGQPQTVCVSVVAIRRGLASDARRGCRTIEAPDAPPPPVDSIRWDTLGITHHPSLIDSTVAEPLALIPARWQWRVSADSLGFRVDSLPMDSVLRVGYGSTMCAVATHVDGTPVVVLPITASVPWLRLARDRCRDAVRLARPLATVVRVHADSIAYVGTPLTPAPARSGG